jgi:hypothetical protein
MTRKQLVSSVSAGCKFVALLEQTNVVIAGLVPAIHVSFSSPPEETRMRLTSARMTARFSRMR